MFKDSTSVLSLASEVAVKETLHLKLDIESSPKTILLLCDVITAGEPLRPALCPNIRLFEPVVNDCPANLPIAVLSLPVVKSSQASDPIHILSLPVVKLVPVALPNAQFLAPVVTASRD